MLTSEKRRVHCSVGHCPQAKAIRQCRKSNCLAALPVNSTVASVAAGNNTIKVDLHKRRSTNEENYHETGKMERRRAKTPTHFTCVDTVDRQQLAAFRLFRTIYFFCIEFCACIREPPQLQLITIPGLYTNGTHKNKSQKWYSHVCVWAHNSLGMYWLACAVYVPFFFGRLSRFRSSTRATICTGRTTARGPFSPFTPPRAHCERIEIIIYSCPTGLCVSFLLPEPERGKATYRATK